RRRHTRSKRDWSSDVCSSDLSFLKASAVLASTAPFLARVINAQAAGGKGPLMAYVGTFSSPLHDVLPTQVDLPPGNGRGIHLLRSEERRVGKECRARRWRGQ